MGGGPNRLSTLWTDSHSDSFSYMSLVSTSISLPSPFLLARFGLSSFSLRSGPWRSLFVGHNWLIVSSEACGPASLSPGITCQPTQRPNRGASYGVIVPKMSGRLVQHNLSLPLPSPAKRRTSS